MRSLLSTMKWYVAIAVLGIIIALISMARAQAQQQQPVFPYTQNPTTGAVSWTVPQSFITQQNGTVTATPTDTAAYSILWSKQTGAIIGLGLNHTVNLAEFNYNDTGTTVNDDTYVGLVANCNLTAPRAAASAPPGRLAAGCMGGTFAARGTAYQGGNLGAGAPQGEIHGLNVIAGVTKLSGGTTPSDYFDHAVIEADAIGCNGCTVKYRYGIYSVDAGAGGLAGTSTQGTTVDGAFVVSSTAGAAGWSVAYALEQHVDGGGPIAATGTVLGTKSAAISAAQGVDLHAFTLSGMAFRGPADNFTVSGVGVIKNPAMPVGTAVASVCIAADGTLIKKVGAC